MKKYLIDVNLPRYFSLWASDEYEHVVNIDDEMKDSAIWNYACLNNMTTPMTALAASVLPDFTRHLRCEVSGTVFAA